MFCPGFFHDTLWREGPGDRRAQGARLHPRPVRRAARAPSLLDADRIGYTRDEADRLASPLPPMSPRGLYWAADAPICGSAGRCPRASRLATHRLRLGLDARLRLPQPAAGRGSARPADRPQLPELDRLARHPPAQAASRGTARHRDAGAGREGYAGARRRHRRRPRPLRARRAGGQRHNAEVGPAARLQRPQRRRRHAADRAARACGISPASSKGDAFDRDSLAAIEPRPLSPSFRALRAFRRQRDGAALARRAGRRDPAGRLSDLYRPALAPAARTDRPRA